MSAESRQSKSGAMVKPEPQTYGDRLDRALNFAKMNATHLAKGLGLTRQAVCAVLRGESNALTAENNSRAAEMLGVNPVGLATGVGSVENARGSEPALSEAETLLLQTVRKLPDSYAKSVTEYAAQQLEAYAQTLMREASSLRERK